MKNRILEFLNKREAVLWVKTYDYHEIEKIFFENNESLENKKVYVYDKESDSFEPMMKNLYATLDEVYPQGIRKMPVILLIKDSIEEILENKNLEYIKEIAETKRDNTKYNLTIIIVNNKKIPSQLTTFCKYIKKSDLKNENNIKSYIVELAAAEKISLTQKEVENILNLLIEDIEEINKKRNNMLYYIFRWLDQFGISGSHLWGYISFRSILAMILALIISAWFGERFIKYLKKKQITEVQRDAQIDPFGVKKIGVPSMGGIIIIVALLIPVILLGRLRNIYLLLMIITTVWLGFLGGMDDFIKIFRHDKEGLKGKYKIVGQFTIGLIVGLVLWA